MPAWAQPKVVYAMAVVSRSSNKAAAQAFIDRVLSPAGQATMAKYADLLAEKPDAFVRFNRGDYEYRYFVEVDRASQSSTVIRRKGDSYVEYFLSGSEQQRGGLFPLVLFITIDDRRRAQIVDALAKLDAEHWRLFQVQLAEDSFIDGDEAMTA